MQELSETATARLRSAGWSPGRRVDTRSFEEYLEQAGFPVHPIVKEFLAEFGGLCLSVDDDRIPIDLDRCSYFGAGDWLLTRWEGERPYYDQLAGTPLCYVGERWSGIFDLLMDENGRRYVASDGTLQIVGDNPRESLEHLCTGEGWRPVNPSK